MQKRITNYFIRKYSKMKININLQPVNNQGSGIAKFANELIHYLSQIECYDLQGVFSYVRRIKRHDLNRFNFPIHYSYIPYKIVYSDLINKRLPINYSHIAGRKADINLFFTYQIPRVKFSGLTISTIHDVIPLKTEVESESLKIKYLKTIQYTAEHSDYIITVSESSKKDIIEVLNYDKNKIIVIPNGVHFSQYYQKYTDAQINNIKNKYNLPKKFILYMGGMRKHKNVDNLIKAYSLLKQSIKEEYHLVISQGTSELRQLTEQLGLKDLIHFTPFIEEEDKVIVYKSASLFTFISSYEGFGIPIIEAQAAGVPVLTSSISSLHEIGKGNSIQVPPNDISAIQRELENILENEDLQHDLVKKGLINAQKYSWDSAGEKLKSFINNIGIND